MFKILVPAVAAMGLVAFAAQTRTPTYDLTATPVTMGWHLSHEGTMAKLAYGVANSDQLALMMTCEPGRSSVVVYGAVQPIAPHLIQAVDRSEELDPLSGGDASEVRIALRDPTLQSLASRGVLRVRGEAGDFDLTAAPAEQRVAANFLAYCGSARV
ncbi:hypothetical protein [uncultured Brevundimonas sp.]|uniref:hypothetical protein n=1 Tax=uncultured Brevundimonas sp. TaxID=213418 RepID=UPI0030ED3B59|tara:strand:+ start:103634 stop:104104 length:471 start_codon:yes stop_codon:yes gene_type:complete